MRLVPTQAYMMRVLIRTHHVEVRRSEVGVRAVEVALQQSIGGLFFSIILYSGCIAYDKPSYLLDDFSGFPLCSRVDPLPYNPARYPDLNKPP
jgi:hypothetical protein